MLQSMTLLLFMAAAVTKDRQSCRIPNILLIAGAVNGCFLRFLTEGWPGIADAAGGALLPFLLCSGLFVLSMIGAGDIKLLMTIGVYLGLPQIGHILWEAFLIGAGLALVRLLDFRLASERWSYFVGYLRRVSSGEIQPYIDMDNLPYHKPWLMHFSIPILLAVLFEQIRAFTG